MLSSVWWLYVGSATACGVCVCPQTSLWILIHFYYYYNYSLNITSILPLHRNTRMNTTPMVVCYDDLQLLPYLYKATIHSFNFNSFIIIPLTYKFRTNTLLMVDAVDDEHWRYPQTASQSLIFWFLVFLLHT